MAKSIGIYVFNEVEVLDFSGPFEVFSVANRLARRDGRPEPFAVATVSRSGGGVTARGGYAFLPSHGFANCPAIDVLIVPGGVVEAELAQPEVVDWVCRVDRAAELTGSVCTGAFLLAEAGILDGLEATTHWEDAHDLGERYPTVRVRRGVPWVDAGRVVTSGGISAGIDMCLYLVGRLEGVDLAWRVARQMEYRWEPPERSAS